MVIIRMRVSETATQCM